MAIEGECDMKGVGWRIWTLRGLALAAVAFGVATIASGGSVLFGEGAATAGHFVPFVVWFNFVAGFFYVAAAVGLWLQAPWGRGLALALALASALIFAAFGIHVAMGGAYEMRTVAAMTLRTLFWAALAALARPGKTPAEAA
jgi:hypothetical protein